MSATMSATNAARSHSSATLAAPLRRAPQPRRAAPSRLRRIGGLVGRKPGRAFMLLAFSALAVAILLNATLFQKSRHPAPILSGPATATQRPVERRQEPVSPPAATPAASAPASPVSAPLPPSRPSELSPPARDAAAPRPPATVAGVVRAAPAMPAAPAPVRSAAVRDPIADLINGADFRPPAEIRGVAPARATAPRRAVEN